MEKLIAVVSKLEEVEAVHVSRDLLAGMVVKIKRMAGVSAHSDVEEVAVVTEHYLIETAEEDKVDADLEDSLSKHLRLALSEV